MNQIVSELASTGVLRAGHQYEQRAFGHRDKLRRAIRKGVAPDMAAEIARRLAVPVAYVKFDRPSKLADAAGTNAWDIGLIGAEPARAEKIAFTPAYCEIEATYLVRERSPLQNVADVDRPGSRIAVRAGSAYDLWLTRNLKHATLLRSDTADGPFDQFVAEGLDALAGLRPQLMSEARQASGRKNSSRQFYRGPTGDRHRQEQRRRRGIPSRICRGGKAVRICRPPDRAA